jgi:hypothetical protein
MFSSLSTNINSSFSFMAKRISYSITISLQHLFGSMIYIIASNPCCCNQILENKGNSNISRSKSFTISSLICTSSSLEVVPYNDQESILAKSNVGSNFDCSILSIGPYRLRWTHFKPHNFSLSLISLMVTSIATTISLNTPYSFLLYPSPRELI